MYGWKAMFVTNSPTFLEVVLLETLTPLVVFSIVCCVIVSNVSVVVLSTVTELTNDVVSDSAITSSSVDCIGTILLSSSNSDNVGDAKSTSICT